MKVFLILAASLLVAGCNDAATDDARNKAAPTDASATADPAGKNFNLRNESRSVVTQIYVSRTGANRWGENILGQNPIPPGENAQVTFPASPGECVWDMKVRANGDSDAEKKAINLCEIAEVAYP
jgi:hypothetical protein